MPFIGNQPALSYTSFAKQDFTTSATTSYTLDNPVANANELALFINFVRQEPTTAYSASGTTLTLTEATSSSDDMYCVYLGKAVQTVNPPNASVGTSQLVDGAVTSAKLSAGKVLQVQSTTKTDTFSSSTADSFVEVTGLNVNITPSSTSSKIFISGIVGIGHTSGTNGVYIKVQRGSTDIGIGDANSSNPRSMAGSDVREYQIRQLSMNFLDSPNTTSQINYKVLILSPNSTMSVNKDGEDGSGDNHTRTISTITVMEISA